jgi:hypothetical protein
MNKIPSSSQPRLETDGRPVETDRRIMALGLGKSRNRTSPYQDSTFPSTAFERSRPAADASRGMYGAVVACLLR